MGHTLFWLKLYKSEYIIHMVFTLAQKLAKLTALNVPYVLLSLVHKASNDAWN